MVHHNFDGWSAAFSPGFFGWTTMAPSCLLSIEEIEGPDADYARKLKTEHEQYEENERQHFIAKTEALGKELCQNHEEQHSDGS
jgi:hypothetical protein